MASTRGRMIMTSTVNCYDAWSAIYDSDGNVLQLLDDVAFEEMAKPLLNATDRNPAAHVCCEFGCGTGRNTTKIIEAGWSLVSEETFIDSRARGYPFAQLANDSFSPLLCLYSDV